MTLFERKCCFLYLADFLPFGNTKAHFSAWKVDSGEAGGSDPGAPVASFVWRAINPLVSQDTGKPNEQKLIYELGLFFLQIFYYGNLL
jgi:hypothetical protein